ncbi:hypothetical protein BOX15_Mlig022007g1 [Macrostomum lignano]|uniref:EGF-like domain-containing protein n=1 Tax=Macrostomum lignano TaxID=282301 RepID=A0A267H3H1_9PLAT|nr:hypothetical protein BOX15_Mlig022007g1 [Macrostomum lignano]
MSVRVGGESGSGIDGGGFRGCVRDLRLVTDDSTLVGSETTAESSNATWGVCSRSMQCGNPSPCEAKTSSMCSDMWNDFVCHCAADFGGRRCSVELPSFSLGVGSSVSSAMFASAAGVSSVYGGDSWTIELRLVTLSRGAFLLLLGDPSDSATTPRLLATIDHSGRMSAQLLHSNGSLIAALTSSDSVATGDFVSVKISVSISGRSLSLSVSSSVSSASLSSASPLPQLSGQLIIGGFSGLRAAPAPSPDSTGRGASRTKRSADVALPRVASAAGNVTAFRGSLRSIKVNGDTPLILVSGSDGFEGLTGAVVASESKDIVPGIFNNTVCEDFRPCRNGATCTNGLYYSYRCVCHPGYSGEDCSVDHPDCSSNPCGADSFCLERSIEALYSNASSLAPFNGSFSYSKAAGFECVRMMAPTETAASSEAAANDFLPTWAIAAIAVAIFLFGVLLTVSVFLLLLNRHRNGKLSLGYFERQAPVLENAKRRSAAKVLSDLKNRLSSRSEHTYLTSDRRPEISTVERYEMAPYDVISDAETKPDEVPPEQEVETAGGSNRFNSELSSAYDVIPDLTASQKQQNQRAAQQVKSNQKEECR